MPSQIKKPYKRKKINCDFDETELGNAEVLTPKYETELTIHPKKLADLKQWFRSKMGFYRGKKTLLLTGPTGSGKRTTIKVLCAELGIELCEWDWSDEYSMEGIEENIKKTSSLRNFVQFLGDTEFCSIQRMSVKHRLLLIRQLPGLFIRDPKYLHEILSDVVPRSRCMIIFILPNIDSCWELNPHRLFPQSVIDSLGITHIKFNAVSTTQMHAAIKRAAQKMNDNLNNEQITDIVNSSFGDIRRAINMMMLQFNGKSENLRSVKKSYITEKSPIKNLTTVKKQQIPNHLELFHFIGKIIYAKRMELADEKWLKMESILDPLIQASYSRPFPPKDDLNNLIDTSPISGPLVVDYIFEHEPNFASSIEATSRISTIVADLDVIVNANYEQKYTLEKYSLDLIIRATIFHNYRSNSTTRKQRFYQFDKPKMRDIVLKKMENANRIAELYPASRPAQLATLILPTLSRISSIPISRRQLDLLNNINLFPNRNLPLRQLNGPTFRYSPIDPEINLELATLNEEEPSPDTSIYSISSQQTDDLKDDGFNYEIEETED